jgi:peptidoglycan-associated lipoprotein
MAYENQEEKQKMKKYLALMLMLAIPALLTTACTKKTMENQSSVDQTVQTEPEAKVEPEPAPAINTQAIADDQAQRDQMADLNRFLSEYVYFDYDSAVIRSDAMTVLRMKAQWLDDQANKDSFVIEGHCDERGTEAYNLALGARRAEAVKQYLVDLGLDAGRFKTQSYGEERPLDSGHNEEAWAKNRRASFVISQ